MTSIRSDFVVFAEFLVCIDRWPTAHFLPVFLDDQR